MGLLHERFVQQPHRRPCGVRHPSPCELRHDTKFSRLGDCIHIRAEDHELPAVLLLLVLDPLLDLRRRILAAGVLLPVCDDDKDQHESAVSGGNPKLWDSTKYEQYRWTLS